MAESARERGEEGDESGGSEYDYVTLTSAEVLEKLEEVYTAELLSYHLLSSLSVSAPLFVCSIIISPTQTCRPLLQCFDSAGMAE